MATLATYYPALDGRFLSEAEAASARLGIETRWLLAIMDFETGGRFSPSVRNPYSGFVGLIQFGPAAASDLGTTTARLAAMSAVEQLAYVEDYFRMRIRQHGPLGSLEDAYMAVLYPPAIGKPDDWVLFRIPEVAYDQNSGLDQSGDGTVTKAEATAPVRRRLKGSAGGAVFARLGGLSSGKLLLATAGGLGLAYAAHTLTNETTKR